MSALQWVLRRARRAARIRRMADRLEALEPTTYRKRS